MAVDGAGRHVGEVQRLVLHAQVLALELVEAAQRAQQPAEALDLLADHPQVLRRRRQHAVLEGLHPRLDGGERGAQLVREVAGHVAPPLLVACEPVGHGVEGGGERRDLVAAARRHPHVEIAGGDVAGGVGELLERPGDAPAHQQADDEREHAGDDAGDQEVARQRALVGVLGGGPRALGHEHRGRPHLPPVHHDRRALDGEGVGAERRRRGRDSRATRALAGSRSLAASQALAAHPSAEVGALYREHEPPVGAVHGHVGVVHRRHLAQRVDGGGVPAVRRLVGGLERVDDGGVARALHLLEVGVEAS